LALPPMPRRPQSCYKDGMQAWKYLAHRRCLGPQLEDVV
jgi:hypothetical protein